MPSTLTWALRSTGPYAVDVRPDARAAFRLIVLSVASAALFGAVMGSFGWKVRGSIYSAVKVPLLLTRIDVHRASIRLRPDAALGLRDAFPRPWRNDRSPRHARDRPGSAGSDRSALLRQRARLRDAVLVNAAVFTAAVAAAQLTLRRHYAS